MLDPKRSETCNVPAPLPILFKYSNDHPLPCDRYDTLAMLDPEELGTLSPEFLAPAAAPAGAAPGHPGYYAPFNLNDEH